jgi:hypothetical protein
MQPSGTLPVGTQIRVKLDSRLRTNVAHKGDEVEATIIEAVRKDGIVALPAGSRVQGKVEAVQEANRKNKISPTLTLSFDQIRLPDGTVLPTSASIAGVGKSEHVNSTGLVTRPDFSNRRKLAMVALFSLTGASFGSSNGGEAVGIGAAAGAGFGGLMALLETRHYSDFELRKGRKIWLRLNRELAARVGTSQ